jgi:hypothetical protein
MIKIIGIHQLAGKSLKVRENLFLKLVKHSDVDSIFNSDQEPLPSRKGQLNPETSKTPPWRTAQRADRPANWQSCQRERSEPKK